MVPRLDGLPEELGRAKLHSSRTIYVVATAAALVAAAACRPAQDRDTSDAAFVGGVASLDELASTMLAAVSAGDTSAMHTLRLSEAEHNELLWPHLPASRPEFNMSVAFAWGNLQRTSVRDAWRIVNDVGGRDWTFVSLDCRKGRTSYGPATVHGDCWVTAANGPDTQTFKVFGSAVEWGGSFKAVGILED